MQDSVPSSPSVDEGDRERHDLHPTDNGLLLSTAVHNPADALRLLASASSALLDRNSNSSIVASPSEALPSVGLSNWRPIKEGQVTIQEAQVLLELYVDLNVDGTDTHLMSVQL